MTSTRRATGTPVESRLLRACVLLTAATVAWVLLNAVHPMEPLWLLWVPIPVSGPLVALLFWRAGGQPGMPASTRRFWRRLMVVVLLVAAGQTVQVVDVLRSTDPGSAINGPAMLALSGLSLVVLIVAMAGVPAGLRDPEAPLRTALDASTLALSTAVFIWHFGTRLDVHARSGGVAAMGVVGLSLLLSVLAMIGVFAVARVLLSEHRLIHGRALRSLAAALFVGSLAPVAQPVLTAISPRLFVVQLSVPLVFLLAAHAAVVQCRAGALAPRRRPTRGVRPFSLLPYTAVAAVDGLLLWVVFTDGEDITIVAVAAVLLTALVVGRQIAALRDNGRLLARLDHGATHDALTGLPNRVLFRRRLTAALREGGDAPVAVVLIDLDDFKEVNDTLGHDVGDELLVGVAERLRGCVRDGDTVARLGGDEFVMVLPGSDPAAADVVAGLLIEALARPVLADGHELAVRASVGIADGRSGDEASLLLRQADIAMYAAKTVAGTAFLHHHAGMGPSGSDSSGLVAELREAIRTDQLFLLYQPIVSLEDGRLIGAEALVRWQHPERGVLAPDTFLPAAERSGLTVALSRWVLGTAFRQLASWPGPEGTTPPMLHVNLSARDLREPSLAAEVADLLREHGVDAHRVTIEITESAALEGGQAIATLHDLRALGLRISLDDFGTGYSTLSLLHEVPVDEIKLDRSFAEIPADGRVPMAAAVMHLAQVLGLHAVAEGVESGEQAESLLALGYVAAQGYHFARPVPPEDFAALVPRPAETPAQTPDETPVQRLLAG